MYSVGTFLKGLFRNARSMGIGACLLLALPSCGPLSDSIGGDGMPFEGIQTGSKTYEYEIATTNNDIRISFNYEGERFVDILDKTDDTVITSFSASDKLEGENLVVETEGFSSKFNNLKTGAGASQDKLKFAVNASRDGLSIQEDYLSDPSKSLPDGVGLSLFFCEGKEDLNYFAGGDGSVGSPYLICSNKQLKSIHENFVNNNFKLMADLDLSLDNVFPDGWAPVGSYEFPFTGEFDGSQRTLSNLEVNGFNQNQGFFGVIQEAKIHDLTISNASIQASYYGGVIAGTAYGLYLDNVHVSGNVDVGASYAGGLFGRAVEPDSKHWLCFYSIKNSTSSVNVRAKSSKAGGLIGSTDCTNETTIISNSHASGDVEVWGVTGKLAGGLVGSSFGGNYSKVSATGNVSCNSIAGGLLGESWYVNIENSFASGDVSANSTAAGLVGSFSNLISISKSYASGSITSTSGRASGLVGGGSPTGKINLSHSFSASIVSSGAGSESGLLGQDLNRTFVNNFWVNSGGGAAACISGLSSVSGCIAESLTSTFYDSSNAPFDNDPSDKWDFVNTWQENAGALPTLK